MNSRRLEDLASQYDGQLRDIAEQVPLAAPDITDEERREALLAAEAKIRAAGDAFIEMGVALADIRGRCLWCSADQPYDGFYAYAKARFGVSRQWTNRLINAAFAHRRMSRMLNWGDNANSPVNALPKLTHSVNLLSAAQPLPDAALKEVGRRLESGEIIKPQEVRKMVAQHHPPPPPKKTKGLPVAPEARDAIGDAYKALRSAAEDLADLSDVGIGHWTYMQVEQLKCILKSAATAGKTLARSIA